MQNRGWEGLPAFSKALYKDTYFLDSETYEKWLVRIFDYYATNKEQATRLKQYASNYWMHPATPISSNGNTDRGLPISCMVGHISDDRAGIFDSWREAAWTGSEGTGIGRYWGDVRELGADVGREGHSSGVIPFMGVDEAITKAVSQGSIRRMSIADYLPVWHPEIAEFIDIRSPMGDQSRRAPELHHGVVIDDKFMYAVVFGTQYDLISPSTNKVVGKINARETWSKLMDMRTTMKGEPFLLFIDSANRSKPAEYELKGWDIFTTQLCTEIMLHTEPDYTNICALASVNAEYYDEWKGNKQFIIDMNDFLDNVIQDFINKTENRVGFEASRKAAMYERATSLGVMGLHSYYQKKHLPFESPMATGINKEIFKFIRTTIDEYQESLPKSARCPMSKELGTNRRNIVTMAVAPTMSISSLCNVTSSGVEPWVTNSFTKKVKQGSFPICNKYLDIAIKNKAKEYNQKGSFPGFPIPAGSFDETKWVDKQWTSIQKNGGSVQHLDWMDDWTKDVFKTAFEIDQTYVLHQAADRGEFIDQGQSVNLFIPANSHVQTISDLHILAWKLGLKSLYYLRSTAGGRASASSDGRKQIETKEVDLLSDACPSCG